MRMDLTPWARAVLDEETKERIGRAVPEDARIHVGRGVTYWRALVTWKGHVIAQSTSVDITEAVQEALDAV